MYGLTVNPFLASRNPASDFADWQALTVDVGGLYSAVSNRESSCVVFGARGRGKTALCRVLEADCRPYQPASNRLAIPFYAESFARLVHACRERTAALDGADFLAAALLQLGDAAGGAAGDPPLRPHPALTPEWCDRLRAACGDILARTAAQAREAHSAALCQRLLAELAPLGQAPDACSIVLLVDEVSESAAALAAASVAPRHLLAALFNALNNCDHPLLKVVAFLPAEWEEPLAQEPWFVLDKVYFSRLRWKEADLGAMLDRRLEFYSRGAKQASSIESLCEFDLRLNIRRDLAALADGRPRCALALAEELIEQHCAGSPGETQITKESWAQVAEEWPAKLPAYLQAEEQVRRVYAPTQAARVRLDPERERVYLGDKPVDVGKQEYRVLAYLYSQQSELCTNDAIIRAAWPDVKQGEGVSEQALTQSLSRLRKAFERISPQVEYIGNKSKRGYVLWPDGKPAQESGRKTHTRKTKAEGAEPQGG
jgi:DNA-binding winged helix-turn-helix (wHTH) protein